MLEKFGFPALMEETVMAKRFTTAMSGYPFFRSRLAASTMAAAMCILFLVR